MPSSRPSALRFAPLSIGALFLAVGVATWRMGSPPAWSVFAPRSSAVVAATRIDAVPVNSGRFRHVPVVEVEPITAGVTASDPIELAGLVGAFHSWDRTRAEATLANYNVGATVATRTVAGTVYADRSDLFQIAVAAFITLVASFVTLLGLAVAGVPLRFVGRLLGRRAGAA